MNRRVLWPFLALAYAAVLVVPFLLRPREEVWEAEEKLQAISPHWEGIKYEFQRGFREWYFQQSRRRADVEWVEIGGTSDILRYLESEFHRSPGGVGIDLVFGGGPDFHGRLKSEGFTQAYRLPPDLLVALPETCAGVPLYDPDFHWYGAALSGFGLIYNKVVFRHRGIEPPDTWEDLARPELFTWVGAADPGKSGSVHMMFEILLQAYGWERGMDLVVRMGGNARSFAEGGSDVPRDVAVGEVAIGMCIDFYAGSKIAEVGPDRIGYVMPEGLTVINPDPICLLKGSPRLETARAFLRYTLSRPGQQVWMLRLGETGGPRRFGLARLGVLPEVYQGDPTRLLVESNPFRQRPGFRYDSRKGNTRWGVLNDFIRAAAIDTHEDAVKAWKALIDHGFPEAPMRRFGEMPVTEEELLGLAARWKDAELREMTRAEWVRGFRLKYLDIARQLEK